MENLYEKSLNVIIVENVFLKKKQQQCCAKYKCATDVIVLDRWYSKQISEKQSVHEPRTKLQSKTKFPWMKPFVHPDVTCCSSTQGFKYKCSS